MIYLPRTEGISSTMLREQTEEVYRIGIVGSGRIARRFVPETKVVNSVKATAVFDPNKESADAFAAQFGVKAYFDKYEEFLEKCRCCVCSISTFDSLRLHKAVALCR